MSLAATHKPLIYFFKGDTHPCRPSMIALAGLARDADLFVTITEDQAAHAVAVLAEHGLTTTPSGGAGVAAALAGLADMDADARVMVILSEGAEDA